MLQPKPSPMTPIRQTASANSRKINRAERLMTQLVRLQPLAKARQISHVLARCLPDSLHLCAQRMQTSLKNCLGGVIQVPITEDVGSEHQPPSRKAVSALDTLFSTPRQAAWPRAAAQHPFATASGLRTTIPTIPTGPFRHSIWEDAAWRPHDETRTHSYLSNWCDAHALDFIMERATQWGRISLKLHQVPRGGDWPVGGANSLFSDWDADLTRTPLQHRLPFLDQDTQ